MNVLQVILGYQFSIGIFEMIIFQLGAIILGFFIHFFLVNRKSTPLMKPEPPVLAESSIDPDEWRLKYYDDMEVQENQLTQLRQQVAEARDNEQLLTIEVEELKKKLKENRAHQEDNAGDHPYHSQLQSARDHLFEHNQSINRLLEQVKQLQDEERKHLDTQLANDSLTIELRELRRQMTEKEATIKQLRQEQFLAGEMKDRLAAMQQEFIALQEKLQKMDVYLMHDPYRYAGYEELEQSYLKLTRDYDDAKMKQLTMLEENQRMARLLADTEDKLRESNFLRQQLIKKVSFLEELNQDLQQVSEHNKKLEIQLKRLGEIETLLHRVTGGSAEKNEE